MKLRFAVTPIALIAAFASYVALHPGVAYAEPNSSKAAPTPMAAKATYQIDTQHTGIYFEIWHLELAKVTGRFNTFSGTIVEDLSDLTKSSVEFRAEIASVDTGVAARDAHLRTADFFEADKYPELTFKSTKIERSGDGYMATGDLTIKGKTKSISIPFKRYGPLTLTVGDNSTRIGVVAEPIVLKRSDFGVGGDFKLPDGTLGASDEVTVRISLEGILQK